LGGDPGVLLKPLTPVQNLSGNLNRSLARGRQAIRPVRPGLSGTSLPPPAGGAGPALLLGNPGPAALVVTAETPSGGGNPLLVEEIVLPGYAVRAVTLAAGGVASLRAGAPFAGCNLPREDGTTVFIGTSMPEDGGDGLALPVVRTPVQRQSGKAGAAAPATVPPGGMILGLANPGPAAATRTLAWFAGSGQPVGERVVTVPAGSLLELSAEELFARSSAWPAVVEVRGGGSGVVLFGRYGPSLPGGNDPGGLAAVAPARAWSVPGTGPADAWYLFNPAGTGLTVQIRGYNAAGVEIVSKQRTLAAHQTLARLRPDKEDKAARRVRFWTLEGTAGFYLWLWSGGAPRWAIPGPEAATPGPVLTGLLPDQAPAGPAGLTLTLLGEGFVAGSEARADGAALVTRYISAQQLEADLPAGALAEPGTLWVTVANPPPGGGQSAELPFEVTSGAPVLTALAPAAVPAGSTQVVLRADGQRFFAATVLRADGTGLPTTHHPDPGGDWLGTILPDALTAASGQVAITAFNPGPGGGESAPLQLTVTGGTVRPQILMLCPAQTLAGAGPVELLVYGRDIDASCQLLVDGAVLPATYQDWIPPALLATLPEALTVAGGVHPVVIRHPANGDSGPVAFVVVGDPAVPVIAGLTPVEAPLGSLGPELLVWAWQVQDGAVLRVDGLALVTDLYPEQWGNPAELRGPLPEAVTGAAGEHAVTVENPGPPPAESAPATLRVVDAAPVILDVYPVEVPQGGSNIFINVLATPIDSNSFVRAGGQECDTTPWDFFDMLPSLDAWLPEALLQNQGALWVTVVNPGPPARESAPFAIQVVPGRPVITGLVPAEVPAGAAGVTLRVDGGPFEPDSVVRIDGADMPTAWHDDGGTVYLTALADDLLLAVGGYREVRVYNPTPWGLLSDPVSLTVLHPLPVLDSAVFEGYSDGCTGFLARLWGGQFLPPPGGSMVRAGGGLYQPIFVSSTELAVALPLTAVSGGAVSLNVENPVPGGGLSGTVALEVPPQPEFVADAGPVQAAVEGDLVTLDGSGGSGPITGYLWEQLSGPAVALSGADQAIAQFTLNRVEAEALLVFRLTVSGDCGESFATTSVRIGRRPAVFDLEILSPAEGDTLHSCVVSVTGRIIGSFDPARVTVLVDGRPAELTGDTFTASGVKLLDGRNRLRASATDLNTLAQARAAVTVYYEPPDVDPPAGDDCGWITGTVYDAAGRLPLAGARLTVEGLDARLYTGADGKIFFPIAGLTAGDPVRTVVLNITAPRFLDAQREVRVKRGRYPRVDDVFLVPADPAVSVVTPAGGTAADSSGRIRLDFPAGAVAAPLQVSLTEIPFGAALPNAMPSPSVWTFAFDVSGDTTEELLLPARVRVANFLGFAPGTPVPVGWYNRRAHRWEHDSMSLITADGQFMEFYITHFSVRDPNAGAPPGDPGPTGPGEEPKDECEKTDGGMSEITIDTGNLRLSYQTVPYKIMGRDTSLTLSYDGNSVAEHFVFTVKVDNTDAIRPDFTTIYLDIAERHYRTTFSSNQAVNYFKIRVPLADGQGSRLQPGTHPYECVVENGYRTYNYWSQACFACEPLTDTGVPLREPYRQRVRFAGNFLLERSDLTQSPYGAGWTLGLDSLKRLYFSADGESVYLQEGSGQPVELRAGMIEKISGTAADVRPPVCQVQPDDNIANNRLKPTCMYFHDGELYYNLILNNPEYCNQLRKVDRQGRLRILIGGGGTGVDWSQTDAIPAGVVENLSLNMSGGGNDYLVHDEQGTAYFASSGGAWNRLFKLDREGVVRLAAITPLDINELCTDHMGNVYTLSWDYANQATVIHKVIANGGVVQIGELHFDAGEYAYDLRVDRALNLWVWVIRATGLEIWKVTAGGDSYPVAGHDSAGTPAEAMFEEGTPASKTRINGILQMFPDGEGNFYYLEYYDVLAEGVWGDRLRKIDAAGQVWTVADFRQDGGLPVGGDGSVMEPFNLNLVEPWSFFFDDASSDDIFFLGNNGHLYKMSRQTYAFDARHRYRFDRLTGRLEDRIEKTVWEFDAGGRPLACTDGNGNRTEYAWNARGLLTAIIDPLGGTISLRYSAAGRLTEVEDPLGRVTGYVVNVAGDLVRIVQPDLSFLQFEYDSFHRMTAKTMADGSRFRYEYEPDYGTLARAIAPTGELRQYLPALNQGQVLDPDLWTEDNPHFADAANMSTVIDGEGRTRYLWTDENGHILAKEDAMGLVTTQEPDGRGLVKTIHYPDDSWEKYLYDENGQLIRVIRQPLGLTQRYFYSTLTCRLAASEDELGRRTTYEYDDGLNLIEQTDPLNHSIHYTHETNGLLRETIDPLGHATRYEYDALGNLAKVTDPLGHETSYVRDGAGNIVSSTDPNGHTSIFTYDDMNRKLTQTDPYGHTTTFTYVCAGTNASSCSCCSGESAKVASVNDPLGHATTFEYDGVGNLIKQTDPLRYFRTMTYDLNRNLETVADEMGRLTSFEYDAAGRQTAVVAPGGARAETAYDAMDRVVSRTDPLGRVTSFEYDSAGRQAAQIDVLGGRTEFSYDPVGNRTGVTDAKGHLTTFTYDALNRLLTETDPLGRTRSQSYDSAGRLYSTTDAKGQTITFTYDDAGRLISKNYPDATQETYVYDANDNLLNTVNSAVSMSYTYDDRNLQLTIVNDTIGKTVSYTYDGNGRKVSLIYPDGETISYTRDARGQVYHLTSNQLGPGGEPPPTVTYAYNPDGSLASMDYGFGMHVARIYDSTTGRLIDLKYTKPDGTVISDFAYTHDAAGNILSKTTDFGLVQYGYDALDRLVLADYDWKADETFAYDAVGNRIADANHAVWQYDAANQLLAYGAGAHDPVGQTPPAVPAFTFAYDANGSTVSKTDLVTNTTDQYGYNFDNQIDEVLRGGEKVIACSYNHQMLRIKKEIFTCGASSEQIWYVYGHEGLLEEYSSNGTSRAYHWKPDTSNGIESVWHTVETGLSYYLIMDDLGVSYKIVEQDYSLQWRVDWEVFGKVLIVEELAGTNLRFPGQYEESSFFLQ